MTGGTAGARPDGSAVAPANGSVPPPVGGEDSNGSETLSEADRAAAFATGRVPVDRAAALRAGSVPVPRKFVRWVIVAFAVLGLGAI
ncbi:MAG: hypothetical protein ABSF33_01025, partial [Acidimicrobiales bacterium]